jgi:hypothetical protein
LLDALAMQRKHLQNMDPLCIATLQKIGSALLQFQEYVKSTKNDMSKRHDSKYIKEDASVYFSEAIDIAVQSYGHNHGISVKAIDMCGDSLLQSARFEDAIRLYHDTIKQRAGVFGQSHECVLQAKEQLNRCREKNDTHLMEQEDLLSLARAQEDRTREELERQKSGQSEHLLRSILTSSSQVRRMAQELLKSEMKREKDIKESQRGNEKKRGDDAEEPPVVHKPSEYRTYRKVDYDKKAKRKRRCVDWFSEESRKRGYEHLMPEWEPASYSDEVFYAFSCICRTNLGTDMLTFWAAVEWFKTLKAGTFEFSKLCSIIHKKFVRHPKKLPCLPASTRNDVNRALISAVVTTTPDIFDDCQNVVFATLYEGLFCFICGFPAALVMKRAS